MNRMRKKTTLLTGHDDSLPAEALLAKGVKVVARSVEKECLATKGALRWWFPPYR